MPVTPLVPELWPTSDVAAAALAANERLQPVIVQASYLVDDRGYSLMNQLQGVLSPQGQINYSVQHPGVIKAWHRHRLQTDFWLCLAGDLKVGIHDERHAHVWEVLLSERRPSVLVIPPGLWHGAATIGPVSAALLYYITHRYDPNAPDEERRPFDSVPDFSWSVRHR